MCGRGGEAAHSQPVSLVLFGPRFFVNVFMLRPFFSGKFKVRVIDTNGVREIDLYAGHT